MPLVGFLEPRRDDPGQTAAPAIVRGWGSEVTAAMGLRAECAGLVEPPRRGPPVTTMGFRGDGRGHRVGGMERVNGIGGYFLRASDPEALSAWYQDRLGVDTTEGVWRQEAGPTVVAAFEAETDYFGERADGFGRQQTMLNFRVDDLDAMLEQLQAAEADVDDEIQEMEGIGRFGWVTDPEGNRIELWEPAPETLGDPDVEG